MLEEDEFDGLRVMDDLEVFKEQRCVIVANHLSDDLEYVVGGICGMWLVGIRKNVPWESYKGHLLMVSRLR